MIDNFFELFLKKFYFTWEVIIRNTLYKITTTGGV